VFVDALIGDRAWVFLPAVSSFQARVGVSERLEPRLKVIEPCEPFTFFDYRNTQLVTSCNEQVRIKP
jgi:hypothetical protein